MALSDFLRFDLSGETRSGGLGAGYYAAIESDEKFPGISETGDPSDRPDPDVPAVPAPDEHVISLLRQIRDRLTKPEPHQVWMTQVFTMTTTAAQKTFAHKPTWRYFYLSNPTTRAVNVYLGAGSTLFLGTVPAGKTMRGEMPFAQDDITVTWAAGGTDQEQITIILSSGKIDVQIV